MSGHDENLNFVSDQCDDFVRVGRHLMTEDDPSEWTIRVTSYGDSMSVTIEATWPLGYDDLDMLERVVYHSEGGGDFKYERRKVRREWSEVIDTVNEEWYDAGDIVDEVRKHHPEADPPGVPEGTPPPRGEPDE